MNGLRRPRLVDGSVNVPLDLVRDPRLSAAAVRFACVLDSFSFGRYAEVFAGPAAVAGLTGERVEDLQGPLAELVDAGWVACIPRGSHPAKTVLLWRLPEDWEDLMSAADRGGGRGGDEDESEQGGGR
jgi:hypothetical protein